MHSLISIILVSQLLASCLGNQLPEGTPEVSDPVPPDGILEAVTWNLEWYGSTSHGPDNEQRQTNNIIEVMDSLRADLYALQEVYNQQALDRLAARMSGYRGFVAGHINGNQKTAFLYNTSTIDSLSSGAITEGQEAYDWANGRFPYYFRFNYNWQNSSIPVYAVVIHAKANTGSTSKKQEAYERRKQAARSLHAYLLNHEPESLTLLLGDYNDDVDVTIFDGSSASPYSVFTGDENNFKAVTRSISNQKQSSYVAGNYTDLIDHIIISDELFSRHMESSEEIFFDALDFIPDYTTTTSDHLPVWTKFDFTQ